MTVSTIVFTDLDGTMLDHADYGYKPARPALEWLTCHSIPLVLCTSKTAAEIIAMRTDPILRDCTAIVENGAGILRAGDDRPEPTATRPRLIQLLDELPAGLREPFSGFSSWTPTTLQQRTGLDPDSAERAAGRDYTEPGLWLGDERGCRRFLDALAGLGIRAQQGGRFLTLGFSASKADRMLELIDERRSGKNFRVVSIALGDAPNDIEMLEKSDYGIVIPNPAHAGIPTLAGESSGRIRRAGSAGPTGWNDSLLTLINEPGFPGMEN